MTSWDVVKQAAAALAVAAAAGAASAQLGGEPVQFELLRVDIDSGVVPDAPEGVHEAVFSTVVEADGAPWVELRLGEVELGPWSYLQITSLEDGATQLLTMDDVWTWDYRSAVFNGDAVLLEVVSQGGGGENRVTVLDVCAGQDVAQPESICFFTDDRELSSDPRVGRTFPNGCTAWLINDCNRCLITAGHCSSSFSAVHFNVPLSDPNGSPNFPPPQDQYPLDFSSLQAQSAGVGADWAYFGCFANSTGLTPGEAQGDAFNLATPPNVQGQPIRITGFGSTGFGVPGSWDGAQKTHVGPYVFKSSTVLQYQTDTTGGNSGSPVIFEDTGEALGVHTHAGCSGGGGANQGTAITNFAFQNALNNPQGVCCDGPFETPPGDFDLLFPAFGQGDVDPDDLTLDWSPSEDAEFYEVILSAEPDLDPPLLTQTTAATSLGVAPGLLEEDAAYFWRVIAIKGQAETVSTPDKSGFFTAPAAPACPTDLNGDLVMNSVDLNMLLAAFGETPVGDIDADGDTDSADLNLLLASFGSACE